MCLMDNIAWMKHVWIFSTQRVHLSARLSFMEEGWESKSSFLSPIVAYIALNNLPWMGSPCVLMELVSYTLTFMWVRIVFRAITISSLFESVHKHGIIDVVKPGHSWRERGLFCLCIGRESKKISIPLWQACQSLEPCEDKLILIFWYPRG